MMSRMRIPALAVTILAVAALGLSACGGDDEPQAPTRAEFIAKTDAQCIVSNARTKTLNEEAAKAAESARDDTQLLRNLAPILERGYEQVRANARAFRAVEPPSADVDEIDRIRRLYDEQAEVVRKLDLTAKRGDVDEYKATLEAQKDVLTRARKAASAYGFKECGSTKSDAGSAESETA